MSSSGGSRIGSTTTILILLVAGMQLVNVYRNELQMDQFRKYIAGGGEIPSITPEQDNDVASDVVPAKADIHHPDGIKPNSTSLHGDRYNKQNSTRNRRERRPKRNQREAKMTQAWTPTEEQPHPYFKFMRNLTHFLSHIPKSGTEYATKELDNLLSATVRLPGNRTHEMVRHAQQRYHKEVYGMFYDQNHDVNFPVDLTGETDGYTPPKICNFATQAVARVLPYYTTKRRFQIKYRCILHVTEQPWNENAQNVYTIVREPLSHTLSQYFHCKESKDHAKRKLPNGGVANDLMPELDDWLKPYLELKESNRTKKAYLMRAHQLKKQFICYNPIDSESDFTKFSQHDLPDDYTYPYPLTKDDDDKRTIPEKRLDQMLFADLEKRFNVIGDTSRMVKSVCAIFIDLTQGKDIPEVCDCTHARTDGDDNSSDTGTFCLPNVQNPKPNDKRCPVRIGYDPAKHSHGVKTHGSAYLKELSPETRQVMSRIRSKDLVLYNVSRAVFDKQVNEMEARYGIKICEKWNRPK